MDKPADRDVLEPTRERVLLERLRDEGLELLAAYRLIEDAEVRRTILADVMRLAESQPNKS